MKEHPILMSTPMVQAILEGRKSQTRRVIKAQVEANNYFNIKGLHVPIEKMRKYCPYGQVGDRLWVRETWCNTWPFDGHKCEEGPCYRATDEGDCGAAITGQKWRPSIFMPRWASRITLEITAIKVQKLQEINEKDAEAEGIGVGDTLVFSDSYKDSYAFLWNKINGKKHSWNLNEWVWVIEFKRIV
jgi:hypothetical protein